MKIVMASDHVGYEMKMEIAKMLKEMNHQVDDIGAHNAERAEYPVYGRMAAEKVAAGEYDRAILICGTGFGISLAANRIKGIRCVNCTDSYTALLSRQHNNANAMALGARVIAAEFAKMLVKIWIEAEFEGGRHADRINMIDI
ncbi:MAG: ribose 5-phosphate isomerase B [Defluviitaleaceae bacterium]|nr:ribose 5-phosphate isomerase B [Defluviitaleaceae bacterium]